jgi:hypothetical protein
MVDSAAAAAAPGVASVIFEGEADISAEAGAGGREGPPRGPVDQGRKLKEGGYYPQVVRISFLKS